MLNLITVFLLLATQGPNLKQTLAASPIMPASQIQQLEAEKQGLQNANENLKTLLKIYIRLEQLELVLEQYPEFIEWKKLMLIKNQLESQMVVRNQQKPGG